MKKLMLEQRAGLRKTELGKLKSGGASYDVVTRLKALLVRKDILIHLRTCMPRFEETFETFMADSWFSRFYIAPDGSLISPTETCKDAEDSDEAPVVSEVSTFTAYTPLMNLLQKINRGSFEASICKIARESVPGSMVSMILKIVAFGFQVEVCVCVCVCTGPSVTLFILFLLLGKALSLNMINKEDALGKLICHLDLCRIDTDGF